jgi:hypothetical protein
MGIKYYNGSAWIEINYDGTKITGTAPISITGNASTADALTNTGTISSPLSLYVNNAVSSDKLSTSRNIGIKIDSSTTITSAFNGTADTVIDLTNKLSSVGIGCTVTVSTSSPDSSSGNVNDLWVQV